MQLRILDAKDKDFYSDDIKKLLLLSDKEFVPPLSARTSALDKTFSVSSDVKDGITTYLEEMKKHEIMAAFENEKLIGFVSYRFDFVSEIISESELPNIYVSTLVLSEAARGKGLTKKMYSYLFNELFAERNVFTRTWSTNGAHTKILSDFGFFEILRKKNDRGEGIDTVYYKKEKARELMGVSI